ncbi:hypothetical protein Dip510_000207 [Elusimicrobium posterum]|uniref:hypothetical protein n=1 Tax=Elusimicrobium posterum TaxID=3116653 RepID=UPI003C762A65
MKKIAVLLCFVFTSLLLSAQDAKDFEHFSQFNGLTIENINVTTTRINPKIVKDKFLLKEGDTFTYPKFDYARKAVHDMRIFKDVDVTVQKSSNNNLDVNIAGEDGYFVFPLPIVMSGGGSTTYALLLMEANLFKRGELGTLMGAFSDDGYMGMLGLNMNDNSYNLFFSDQDYDQKVYTDGSYNTTGVFGGSDDDDNGRTVGNIFKTEKQVAAVSYGRSVGEKFAFSAAYSLHDVKYKSKSGTIALPDDDGSHNQFSLGVKYYNNIKPSKGMAGAFGSIFGLGMSDKEERLAKLPYVKPGYFVSLDYSNGGSYTGADADISTLSASVMGNLELKSRHTLYAVVNGAQNFEGGFYDSVSSSDLLAGKGRYATEYLGQKGFGGGLFASIFVMKNSLAVMVLEPFIETSYTFDNHVRYNQSGAGASLYVTFWRFQLPLGVNYTKDITNGDDMVSFVMGAGF